MLIWEKKVTRSHGEYTEIYLVSMSLVSFQTNKTQVRKKKVTKGEMHMGT